MFNEKKTLVIVLILLSKNLLATTCKIKSDLVHAEIQIECSEAVSLALPPACFTVDNSSYRIKCQATRATLQSDLKKVMKAFFSKRFTRELKFGYRPTEIIRLFSS